ncbi:hypothetical protein [Myxococcus landrumensis]|uniref:Uncharacterized protein n=1 Tax=Myxococcus landrumensis TaxID=2813577 RepID=A0ABX7N616_9BACT|nr:hypothetical protein [Myxococcus landrumus]QSQ13009.1 hypothetical protein JY572_32385 [Myxococcus landrumus]
MNQRTHSQEGARGAHTSDEDVRVQLEGRAEVLESARARAAALESVLRGRRWKRKLRAKPTLVAEWLQHAEAVAEALERTARRAEVEGWPDSLPLMRTVRELAVRKQRLSSLVRERLGRLVSVTGPVVLEGELRRLEALVRRHSPRSPEPGEVVLYQTDKMLKASSSRELATWVGAMLGGFGAVFGLLLATLGHGPWSAGVPVALLVAMVLGVLFKSGRVWLTGERLLWVPTLGEAVSVPLESIPVGGVTLERALSLRVDGEPRVQVPFLSDARHLATLIELHSQPPLRGLVRTGVKLSDAVVYPAVLKDGAEHRSGWAVLRPAGVSFVPEGTGSQVLSTVLGREVALPAEAGWVLEQLRWLSATEFDAWVARLVGVTGGTSWSAWDRVRRGEEPLWKQLRFTKGNQVLSGQMEWPSHADAERVLGFWPSSP